MNFETHLRHVGDTQNKANRVQDIGLARSIETSNRIERRVPSCDLSPNWVWFETWKKLVGVDTTNKMTVLYLREWALLSAYFVAVEVRNSWPRCWRQNNFVTWSNLLTLHYEWIYENLHQFVYIVIHTIEWISISHFFKIEWWTIPWKLGLPEHRQTPESSWLFFFKKNPAK